MCADACKPAKAFQKPVRQPSCKLLILRCPARLVFAFRKHLILEGATDMPRLCNREGCGRRIVGSDGRPSYDRHFCSAGCRREDKRERVEEMRRKARIGRCGLCGRKAGKDAPQNSAVPRHNTPSVDFGSALNAKQPRDAIAS